MRRARETRPRPAAHAGGQAAVRARRRVHVDGSGLGRRSFARGAISLCAHGRAAKDREELPGSAPARSRRVTRSTGDVLLPHAPPLPQRRRRRPRASSSHPVYLEDSSSDVAQLEIGGVVALDDSSERSPESLSTPSFGSREPRRRARRQTSQGVPEPEGDDVRVRLRQSSDLSRTQHQVERIPLHLDEELGAAMDAFVSAHRDLYGPSVRRKQRRLAEEATNELEAAFCNHLQKEISASASHNREHSGLAAWPRRDVDARRGRGEEQLDHIEHRHRGSGNAAIAVLAGEEIPESSGDAQPITNIGIAVEEEVEELDGGDGGDLNRDKAMTAMVTERGRPWSSEDIQSVMKADPEMEIDEEELDGSRGWGGDRANIDAADRATEESVPDSKNILPNDRDAPVELMRDIYSTPNPDASNVRSTLELNNVESVGPTAIEIEDGEATEDSGIEELVPILAELLAREQRQRAATFDISSLGEGGTHGQVQAAPSTVHVRPPKKRQVRNEMDDGIPNNAKSILAQGTQASAIGLDYEDDVTMTRPPAPAPLFVEKTASRVLRPRRSALAVDRESSWSGNDDEADPGFERKTAYDIDSGYESDYSTSSEEILIPVVRPQPKVPPNALASDSTLTPYIEDEDMDTADEAERHRRCRRQRVYSQSIYDDDLSSSSREEPAVGHLEFQIPALPMDAKAAGAPIQSAPMDTVHCHVQDEAQKIRPIVSTKPKLVSPWQRRDAMMHFDPARARGEESPPLVTSIADWERGITPRARSRHPVIPRQRTRHGMPLRNFRGAIQPNMPKDLIVVGPPRRQISADSTYAVQNRDGERTRPNVASHPFSSPEEVRDAGWLPELMGDARQEVWKAVPEEHIVQQELMRDLQVGRGYQQEQWSTSNVRHCIAQQQFFQQAVLLKAQEHYMSQMQSTALPLGRANGPDVVIPLVPSSKGWQSASPLETSNFSQPAPPFVQQPTPAIPVVGRLPHAPAPRMQPSQGSQMVSSLLLKRQIHQLGNIENAHSLLVQTHSVGETLQAMENGRVNEEDSA